MSGQTKANQTPLYWSDKKEYKEKEDTKVTVIRLPSVKIRDKQNRNRIYSPFQLIEYIMLPIIYRGEACLK